MAILLPSRFLSSHVDLASAHACMHAAVIARQLGQTSLAFRTCTNGVILGAHQQQLSACNVQQAAVFDTNPGPATKLLALLLRVGRLRARRGRPTALLVRVSGTAAAGVTA
jgi:hypothetical protein